MPVLYSATVISKDYKDLNQCGCTTRNFTLVPNPFGDIHQV